jgi:hypothetical protein
MWLGTSTLKFQKKALPALPALPLFSGQES